MKTSSAVSIKIGDDESVPKEFNAEDLVVRRIGELGEAKGREYQHTTYTDLAISPENWISVRNVTPLMGGPQLPRKGPENPVHLTRLQEWEGYVTVVRADSFCARLRDITGDSAIENEEADFPIDELSETNKRLLREGAVFRWVIGYNRTRGGNKQRVSQIDFRRLPQWTKKDLVLADQEAIRLASRIRWN